MPKEWLRKEKWKEAILQSGLWIESIHDDKESSALCMVELKRFAVPALLDDKEAVKTGRMISNHVSKSNISLADRAI